MNKPTCCEECYGRQGTLAGGGTYCSNAVCPCHTQKATEPPNVEAAHLRAAVCVSRTRGLMYGASSSHHGVGLAVGLLPFKVPNLAVG